MFKEERGSPFPRLSLVTLGNGVITRDKQFSHPALSCKEIQTPYHTCRQRFINKYVYWSKVYNSVMPKGVTIIHELLVIV